MIFLHKSSITLTFEKRSVGKIHPNVRRSLQRRTLGTEDVIEFHPPLRAVARIHSRLFSKSFHPDLVIFPRIGIDGYVTQFLLVFDLHFHPLLLVIVQEVGVQNFTLGSQLLGRPAWSHVEHVTLTDIPTEDDSRTPIHFLPPQGQHSNF